MFFPHRGGEYDPNESITTLGYAFTGDLSLILTLSLMFDEYINRWIESGLVSKNILNYVEFINLTGDWLCNYSICRYIYAHCCLF